MFSAVAVLALALAAQAASLTANTTASTNGTALVGSKSFSAPAVRNPNYVRNGTKALLKAYAKHNLVPTKAQSPAFLAELSSLKKRQDGSAPAAPYEGEEYLVETIVGGQTLNLDFDTGSADLWVFSSSLPAADKTGHTVYVAADSPTYKKLSGYTWDISYADGSGASGTVGRDTVTIGGTSVTGQAVELATKVSSEFVSDGSDGLVGLAFSSINTVSPVAQSTFFENAQADLDSPLFAAYLPLEADGAYDFGFIDSSKYTGTIEYANVDSSGGFWEYSSVDYKVGSTVHTSSGITGISDTGTTLILMIDSVVEAYYAQVSSASYSNTDEAYIFDCDATLPTLSFKVGSNYATIPGSLLNYETLTSSGIKCYGALQSVGSGTQHIYGDVFFQAYYGIFDASGPQFGFAPIA